MPRPTLRARVHYGFDRLMALGTWALISWHLVVALAAVLSVSVLIVLLGIEPPGDETMHFPALVWHVLMHAITPSTVTRAAGGPAWRAVMMTATVFGILLVGSLVGVLVTNVKQRFDVLSEGQSLVLEHDHTLIVGWSRQLFTIISELVLANESRGGGVVVVYADHDKRWMEAQLRRKLPDTGRTRVVVRAGDPTDPGTLAVVSPDQARALIVLAAESARDDTQVIRQLLAMGRTSTAPGRVQHVVTELADPNNVAVAKLTSKRRTEVLLVGDLIAKIAVQTCLQAGLSVVYEELLSFRGNELYFSGAGALAGRSFGDALHDFASCSLLGIRDVEGGVVLRPPMERIIADGEQVIVLALDDDEVHAEPWSGSVVVPAPEGEAQGVAARGPTRVLILGWNERVPTIVRGIDAYVGPGSELAVVSDSVGVEQALAPLFAQLSHTRARVIAADIGARDAIAQLQPHTWDHVMVLPADELLEADEADAKVLVALLHLREFADSSPPGSFSVVSEVRDLRSRDLAEVARADDFIISDRLIGLLLAQVAEAADLGAVFGELLEPAGAEIYLRPTANYVELGVELEYRALVEAGRRRGEVVLGVRVASEAYAAAANFGVRLNPPKSARLCPRAGDCVVVLTRE